MAKIIVKGDKLIIEVDLSQERKASSSGKSMLIEACTEKIDLNGEDLRVGLNIYVPKTKK